MPTEVKIPAVGESITEVQIGDWLKAENDAVAEGENIVVIESEKATVELPAPASGKLGKILKRKGEMANVGDLIAEIESSSSASAEEKSSAKPEEKAPAVKESKPGAKGEETKPEAQDAKTEAKDAKAEAKGSKPSAAKPKDAPSETAPPPKPKPAATPPVSAGAAPSAAAKSPGSSGSRAEEVVPMTMLRRTAARRLMEAQHNAALLTTFNEADMSAVMGLRKEFGEAFHDKHGIKLGFMSFFTKVVIEALKRVPQINAAVRGDDIVFHNYFDIGIAISSGRGLVVPVLRNAERLSFAEIEKAIAEFAQNAGNGKLSPADLSGATFTITNGGIFGSLLSTPIVNPPESGVLGMHAIQERPIAVAGQVVIRPMMYLALTYDHRIVDGREAVTFLKLIKNAIENPARMLIEV
jgi:2-oxoglutarate dehydrogenase E2 component (dihydrolipoamide succinyltransferase)